MQLAFVYLLAVSSALVAAIHVHNSIRSLRSVSNHRRQLIDGLLTPVQPLTDKLPLSKGIDVLTTNATVSSACSAISKSISPSSRVDYFGSLRFVASIDHYMSSSSQVPVCVFTPTTPKDISVAMQIISQRRIEFGISSGKHCRNEGFCSTKGIQIHMKGFQQVLLSSDKTYVDIGPGNVWDNIYEKLKGTGRSVLGGRVTGVGCGGLLCGGGGYSYWANQYGLTADSVISMDVVLPDGRIAHASKSSKSDLFFALKGGGNQFGVVYNIRLKTISAPDQVWGGYRSYSEGDYAKIIPAIYDFLANNIDDKAAIIPTFNNFLKLPVLGFIAFYDGPTPPGGIFDRFDVATPNEDEWGTKDINAILRTSRANMTAGLRGCFHTVSVQHYSQEIIELAASETKYWAHENLLKSGIFFSIVPENVRQGYGSYSDPSANAWAFHTSPQPMSLYFGWLNPLDDDYYHEAIKRSAAKIRQQALDEGQDLRGLNLYPNYALFDTPAEEIYGFRNLDRLRRVKARYDPDNVMRLAGSFDF